MHLELHRRNKKIFNNKEAEQVRIVKQQKNASNIAKHAWYNEHIIDFDNAQVIDKGNFRCRLTLESWHTVNNNSKPLPRKYTVLIKKT